MLFLNIQIALMIAFTGPIDKKSLMNECVTRAQRTTHCNLVWRNLKLIMNHKYVFSLTMNLVIYGFDCVIFNMLYINLSEKSRVIIRENNSHM